MEGLAANHKPLESAKRLLTVVAIGAGVVAAATMGSVGILWVWNDYEVPHRAAVGMIQQLGWLLGWKESGLIAGLAAGLAIPLATAAWRGGKWVRSVIATWSCAAATAAFYASTLPNDTYISSPIAPGGTGVSYALGTGLDIRWHLLALGLQTATIGIALAAWAIIRARHRRVRPAIAAAMVAIACGPISGILIVMGLTKLRYL